ncbi:hypothetical protein CFP56_033944 [Quercus suber]|uniref:Uncharacterized protein n=1 Tax=Quercus suber TaxID=58331 RepID=A0AAW0JDI4_QUESU
MPKLWLIGWQGMLVLTLLTQCLSRIAGTSWSRCLESRSDTALRRQTSV